MTDNGRVPKILLIDSNVYFSKRLSDALKREGFAVQASTQPAFALTTLEYDTPTAVVCSTNMREMGALEIAKIIHADPKNSTLPIIALGDGSQRALMEAFQAGCDDYIDRQRQPAVIATHIRNILISKAEGFQPTQMLAQADTSLSGSLSQRCPLLRRRHHNPRRVRQPLRRRGRNSYRKKLHSGWCRSLQICVRGHGGAADRPAFRYRLNARCHA